jgi:hypothetical protein
MDVKQNLIHELAVKAGIVKDEDKTLLALRNGCRGYIANLEELTEFARLVGEIARESERKRLHNSHKAI